MKSNKRVLYYDYLTLAACLAVLALHSASSFHTGFRTDKSWIFGLFRQSIYMWCVPIFFMLTGSKLLNFKNKYSIPQFLLKRTNIVISYILWTVIYIILWINFRDGSINGLSQLINMFVNTESSMEINSYFWFFMALFEVYLQIPIFTNVIDNEKYLRYSLAILSVIYVFFPIASRLFNIYISIPRFGNGYIFYVLLGYYLSNINFRKKTRYFLYFLGVLGAIAKFVGILVFSYKFNQTSSVFGGYFSPVVVAMAVAVFVFFKYLNYNKLEKINHFISKLSSLTFGVYLVQYAVIRYYFYNRYNQFSIKVMIIQYVVISITCFTISFLIRKIPKIGKILVP